MTNQHQSQLHARFREPEAVFRPAPLWVWNDEMETEAIVKQLQEMADAGYGGAFVHPRPGLVTEYLSDAWFDRWEDALTEAERLGLKLYIYDENSYPSGFAGGHVPSELPDCLANAVLFGAYSLEELKGKLHASSPMLNRPGHPIRVFCVREKGAGAGTWEVIRDVTALPQKEWGNFGDTFWVFELGTPETNSWLGGFAYTDQLRPEVTAKFLETTYERYRSRFGEKFGGAIPALFTDEPEISPGNLFQGGDGFLPFTYWFAAEFEKRNGYDVRDVLPCLFRDAEMPNSPYDARKIRFDYYSTIHELWTNNAVRPISEWCERAGIAYTGHYLEHNWPHPFGRCSPSVMSMYEYMHWPAIDMLMTDMLKSDGTHAHFMITIREAHSAANQLGKTRVLCEAYGAGGWDSTFEDYKRIGDWLFVHGINFMNPHLTYSTIVGARKRDHPQSFDWRQCWWAEYRELNDYFARLSCILSQGATRNRVLVLNPTTSSYLYTPADLEDNAAYTAGIEETRLLAQRLADAMWDYDFGDEYMMARHGAVEGKRLTIGFRKYDVVIVPRSAVNLNRPTAELLTAFAAGGGTVLCIGGGPQRMDGLAADCSSVTNNWLAADGVDALLASLAAHLEPHASWAAGPAGRRGAALLRREQEDGSVVFFVTNSAPEAFSDVLLFNGSFVSLELWDPFTGDKREPVAAAHFSEEGVRLKVCLEGSGSLLVRLLPGSTVSASGEAASAIAVDQPSVPAYPLPLAGPITACAEADNLLPIVYCDLHTGSKSYIDSFTAHAARLAFEHHGFETNPWDNGVQFKRRLLDRNGSFDTRTGFRAVYRFRIRAGERLPGCR